MTKRFVTSIFVMTVLTTGAALSACQDTECPIGDGPDSCNAFQPGTDMTSSDFGVDESIQGQLAAYAQATGNLAVVAGDALTSVTAACRNIAIDLGDDPTGGSGTTGGATGKSGTDLLDYWCKEATQNVSVAVAGAGGVGNVTLSVSPATCSASIQQATLCQSLCASDGGTCSSASLTCTGGAIEATCTGSCTGSAPFDCVGSCAGQCSGSCAGTTAKPVTCDGICDGMCVAKAGLGDGPQADGTCKGMCSGTCAPLRATVSCEGLCTGQCDGTCSVAPGQSKVTCSGKCDGSSEPIACSGGTLGGGCATDSDCQANCNAAAQAAALCTPARVVLSNSSSQPDDESFEVLVATIEKNLPAILLVVQGQGDGMATTMKNTIDGAMNLTSAKPNELDVAGVVCVADMIAAVVSANADFAEVLADANKVSAAVGGPTAK